MSNFKSGSGNLDFGGDDEDDEEESETSESQETPTRETAAVTGGTEEAANRTRGRGRDAERTGSSATPEAAADYPYFVRRNNVGDERDTRLEIHVRDDVAAQESEFRNELAERLGASEVSKTDAREFALLAAFENPEAVAELMEEDGFGTF
ncbi:acyl-CoA dehydrogenase [Halorientalis sp.]|uniref:acyl-CoA dehydrogenase n=1 Tax=Halorientalis sp. TaxID=1931229 RepID=UPI00261CACA1|nr:acyl-CoA dehydrogenase [Halorientalis sp.]